MSGRLERQRRAGGGSGKEAEVWVEKDRETLGAAGAVGGRETGAR